MMNATYELKMPRMIYGGRNALDRIRDILEENGVKKLAVFTDKGIEGAGLLSLPLEAVKASGAEYMVFNEIPAEPSYIQAQQLVDACRTYNPDCILAVGGGSVMDTAKLSSILMTDEYGIKELLDNPGMAQKCLKTIMVPTTAGTGAEATPNAIVSVPEKELKVGIVNSNLIADYVVLDANMIRRLPKKIAAATGIDALAHAIECWTSKKATPFSDIFSLQALKLIFNNIEAACEDPDATEAKTNMLTASFFAGVAITASGTTAVHALSYPLGGKYHIPHGVSNAILLAPVMRFNEPACEERFAAAYDYCMDGGLTDPKEKSRALVEKLGNIVKRLEIPEKLSELGVPAEDLEDLVKAGMQVTRLLNNNMREVTPEDARNIYREIM